MIQDDVDDLQIVKGGWQDARKGDAFEEVKHMFSIIEHPDCCTDMWAPASRTKFIRVTLAFPDPLAHISTLRSYQMHTRPKSGSLVGD